MLDKFLKSIGVKSYEELNQEERETYKEWEISLSGKKLTDKEVVAWLHTELDFAILRLVDVDLKPQDEIFRKVEVRLLKKIINYLNSPVVAKEYAQKAIEQLIK